MNDSPSSLEREVAELRARLRDVEHRLDRLERRPTEGPLDTEANEFVPSASIEFKRGGEGSTRLITLTGRTFVLLGIGHLLRGLTDSGTVAPPLGIGIGFAYALAWVGAASRAVAHGRRRSAAAFAITASIIAFPLLWESVTRFRVLSAPLGASILTIVGLSFLFLAARWRLHAFALVGVAGAIAAGLALSLAGRAVPACALSVVSLAGASLWVAWARGWRFLPWMTAGAANVVTLGVVAAAASRKAELSPLHGVAFGLLLVVLYLGSAVLRLRRSRAENVSLTGFDIVQCTAALAIGYGGAVAVARASGEGTSAIVIVSVLAIATCYASSFGGWLGGKPDRRSFSVFNTLALAFVLTSSALALPRAVAAVLWAGLAVVGPVLCHRLGRVTFAVHGAASAVASAIASGLVALSVLVFTASPPPVAEARVPAATWVLLAAIGTGLVAFGEPPHAPRRRRLSVSRLVYWGLLVIGLGAVATRALSPSIATGEAASAHLGSLRTVVLAAVVTLLGLLSLRSRLADARRLVYPLLVLLALKLVVEDFPNGHPTNLFVSLGAFGVSLIVAARLVARSRRAEEPHPAA